MKKRLFLLLLIIMLVSCHKAETSIDTVVTTTKKTIVEDTVKPILNKNINDTIGCIDVVLEILSTAPSFVKETKGLDEAIIKNGGDFLWNYGRRKP